MRAYDMSRFHRVIAVDGGRITGTFTVSASDPSKDAWVYTHDVTLWDSEEHRSGIVFYSRDLIASVREGEAKLSKRMIASTKLADVEEVWDEMLTVLVAVVAQYWATAPEATAGSTPKGGNTSD